MSLSPLTRTGDAREMVVPSPNWPRWLSPHAQTVPSLFNADENLHKMLIIGHGLLPEPWLRGPIPGVHHLTVPVLYALGALGSLRARLTGKDAELSLASVRMMRAEAPVDHRKAVRELGWRPRPVEESIREAARFWAAMRAPKKNSTTAPAE